MEYIEERGIHFHAGTPEPVRRALASAWAGNHRIRLWYGDQATGEAWLEDVDVVGYVGRSTGRIKVPLLIHSRRAIGGCAILDGRIVRIDTTQGVTLYRHPTFSDGTQGMRVGFPLDQSYSSTVIGPRSNVVAQFRSPTGAGRWLRFMRGQSYRK